MHLAVLRLNNVFVLSSGPDDPLTEPSHDALGQRGSERTAG